jgi:hypothetical protein
MGAGQMIDRIFNSIGKTSDSYYKAGWLHYLLYGMIAFGLWMLWNWLFK